MAYDLKHTGEAIDAAIYAVERGSVVTDNTVSSIAPGEAKPASADAIAKELQKKVDKVEGKGLSTNDFTNDYENAVRTMQDVVLAKTFLTTDYYDYNHFVKELYIYPQFIDADFVLAKCYRGNFYVRPQLEKGVPKYTWQARSNRFYRG